MRRVQEHQVALDTPWLLIKLSAFSEGLTVPQNFIEVFKDRMETINICRLSLVRKRQHLVREEFVARPGLAVSATQTVKCIFGFSMRDDGCTEKTTCNCEDCGAFCCELHRPHSSHRAEVEATPTLVLQQQISASATSNNSSTAVAPSLAEVTSGAKRPPGKNTKADLKQRYLAATGRQTLDSKYSALKVADLRLIVEGLERGVAPETIPTAAGSSVHSSTLAGSQVAITPVEVLPVLSAAQYIPVNNLSTTDQVMSTLVWTMLQSNPALRDQLLLSMQGGVASLSQGSCSVQIGSEKGTQGGGDECGSDDDNTFE